MINSVCPTLCHLLSYTRTQRRRSASGKSRLIQKHPLINQLICSVGLRRAFLVMNLIIKDGRVRTSGLFVFGRGRQIENPESPVSQRVHMDLSLKCDWTWLETNWSESTGHERSYIILLKLVIHSATPTSQPPDPGVVCPTATSAVETTDIRTRGAGFCNRMRKEGTDAAAIECPLWHLGNTMYQYRTALIQRLSVTDRSLQSLVSWPGSGSDLLSNE